MNSQINFKWEQQVSLPCIAGIGFVIENEMKCFVFIFLPFIADYRLVIFACCDFH